MVTAVALLGFAAEGDVEPSPQMWDLTHGLNVPQYEPAQRETIEVIIGTQVTGNYIPFWGNSYNACRFQTLYLQSEINQAGQIVIFSFMPSTGQIGTYDNMRVYMCHTNVSQLSTTFDLNYGGQTPILVIDEASMMIGNAGNVWMDWDVAFDYNNTDNLLIEIRWNGDNNIGVPIWRTGEAVPRRLYAWDDNATTGSVGDQCYYAKLAISTGPPPDHDVGCIAIDAPGSNIMPNTTLDPTATYRNFGTNPETFDVYYLIDSSGINIYNETANITLAATTDTTIAFASWTCGSVVGTTYDITAYTVLANDSNPANDTLTQQTVVDPTYWEILDPPGVPHASSGHSMATVNDGYVWAMCMHPSSGYLPDCDRYDIANNTWDASYTSDPYSAGSYGTANAVNGKIYVIGGTVSWPTGQTRCDIYDPASNTWAQGASAPVGLLDHAAGVYYDRYIITFGNGNWSMTPTNEVYVYDTELDTWTAGTSFPGTARGCAAFGVIDTYAVGACGYEATGNYSNQYIVGMIDPANPANITWGAWNTIPGMAGRYRVPSAQDDWNKCVWVINGQNGPFSDTWSYDPYTDTWTDWNKPKPQPIGNVTPLAVTITTIGDVGVYAAGGYTGAYVDDNEVFHTGAMPGVSETPGEMDAIKIGFAPTMNPVKDFVSVSYTIDKPANVSLRVYDHSGRLVRTLVNNREEIQGTKTVHWNAKDDTGRNVANGVYFFSLEAAGKTATQKLILVK
jgi:hypothetical protein